MSKKQFMIGIINEFLDNAPSIPQDLESKLNAIKENLMHISEDELELISNGAVTQPASEQDLNQNNVFEQLHAAYSQMESIAYSGERNEALDHVILKLRGLYDISDRYFP